MRDRREEKNEGGIGEKEVLSQVEGVNKRRKVEGKETEDEELKLL